MYKITARQRIQGVVANWENQYKGKNLKGNLVGVLEKLQSLNLDECSKEDVNCIIGNRSWTVIICDECRKEVESAISVGSGEGYDSAHAVICVKCMKDALKLLKETT